MKSILTGQQSNTLTLPVRNSNHSPVGSPTDSSDPSSAPRGKHQRPRARSVETDPGRRTVSLVSMELKLNLMDVCIDVEHNRSLVKLKIVVVNWHQLYLQNH